MSTPPDRRHRDHAVGDDGYPSPVEKNHLGTLSLGAALVGVLGLLLPADGYLPLLAGLVAVGGGVLGLRAARQGRATNRTAALVGVVLGVLLLLVVLAGVIGLALWVSATEQ